MRKRPSFELRLARLSLLSSLPLLIFALWMMAMADISIWLILLVALLGLILLLYVKYQIQNQLAFQIRSISNLMDALTSGEYALRGPTAHREGALQELVAAINALALRLTKQRWESVESQLLVRTIIEHIDVAIIALDEEHRISFHNPAARKLLMLDGDGSNRNLLEQLAFVRTFHSGRHQVIELALGPQVGRFNVHVEEFREAGTQHKLLFITDVGTLLRAEERSAWQRLVRVISHEINNSLSPIASISKTLKTLIAKGDEYSAIKGDLTEGLTTIMDRANALNQFVRSYQQLAKLPEPSRQLVSILQLIQRIKTLFKNRPIEIDSDEDLFLYIDPVLFEQALINLIKNGFEAMGQHGSEGSIRIGWQVSGPLFRLNIQDQGGGIANPDNLFVPFYTTKKQGSGIGLLLCRQIIESHNGRISINNLKDGSGCCVRIEVPIREKENC